MPPFSDEVDGLVAANTSIAAALAMVGANLLSAGPFVFDAETHEQDNHHNLKDISKHTMKIKVGKLLHSMTYISQKNSSWWKIFRKINSI